MNRLPASFLPVLLLAAACTSAPVAHVPEPPSAEDAAKFAAAKAHAAPAVTHVDFIVPIDSIEVIDPHAVLVWETPFKAWLVDLEPGAACRDLDDRAALAIDTLDDSLNSNNGYIRSGPGRYCKISTIREIDVKAWRATLRESGNAYSGT